MKQNEKRTYWKALYIILGNIILHYFQGVYIRALVLERKMYFPWRFSFESYHLEVNFQIQCLWKEARWVNECGMGNLESWGRAQATLKDSSVHSSARLRKSA